MQMLSRQNKRTCWVLVATCCGPLTWGPAFGLSLAHEPLSVIVPVQPNLLLGIDDSGSMDSEVLFDTNDGALWWNATNQSFVGLDSRDHVAPGTLNYNRSGVSDATWKKYVYLFPNGDEVGARVYDDQSGHYAIPPTLAFAFARSPVYNLAYYDTLKTYLPWSSAFGETFTDAPPTAAPTDPVFGAITIDLTESLSSSSPNWTFRLQPGMPDPSGSGFVSTEADATLTYFPATFYTVDDTGACGSPNPSDYAAFVSGLAQPPTGIDAYGPDGRCLVEYRIVPDSSFPSGRSYAAELQNFANWFTYHRKRHQAMRGGVLSAFSEMSGIRVGVFGFNDRPSSLSVFALDERPSEFLDGVRNLVGSGGTPTREALTYIGRQLERSDDAAPIELECQKNFALLFTDGFAVPNAISGIGNEDGDAGVPYADEFSSTLGDIAMRFYQGNLRADLDAGAVPTSSGCGLPSPDPALDCNADPHMVTYGIGLGIRGTVFGITHSTRQDALVAPPLWPEPNVLRSPVQIDDLYHATVNGRGELLNARTPDGIAEKLDEVLASIRDAVSSASSVATDSTSAQAGALLFQARFHSGTWSGQLLAKTMNKSGVIASPSLWDAGEVLTAQHPNNRKVLTLSRDTRDGMPFRWSKIAAQVDHAQTDALNTDAFGIVDGRGSDRVAYLRGATVPDFRARASLLGDIVHSTPFYVGAPRAGYAGSGYASFVANHSARPPVVYIGANDGMLHGFDASSGAEVLAYVPSAVYSKLTRLTAPEYGQSTLPHRYTVDGSPMVADAMVDAAWRTVLVGGLNGGGQGYYALDISDPGIFAETDAAAAQTVLWEFTDEDDADLGFSFNAPTINQLTLQSAQIAETNDGRWQVVVGNGYDSTHADSHASTTGHAVLFLLDLTGGGDGTWAASDYRKIDTAVGSLDEPNGLATPTPVDIDGDGDIDVAYAGDLQGNVWKFDLTDASPDNWTVTKFFQALDDSGNPQPITTAMMVFAHEAGGFIVSFGTGKYLEAADLTKTDRQTLYGLLDASANGSVTPITTGRLALQKQEILGTLTVGGRPVRVSTGNAVDYTEHQGWYMDLPETGERVAVNPIPRDGRAVFVTQIPSIEPCAAGGTGWIMELDFLTGGRLDQPPFDLNDDSEINAADLVEYADEDGTKSLVASGVALDIGMLSTPTPISRDERTEHKVVTGSRGEMGSILEGKSLRSGRLSWKQIIGEHK
jgi:type IV pilus assembly protein PilY1